MSERFTIWRQKVALTDLADQGFKYLDSDSGRALLTQLDEHFAGSVVGLAKSWGHSIDNEDVVHMILERLVADVVQRGDHAPIRYAAAADDPWAYLWQCVTRWARDLWGTRADPLEYAETMPAYEPVPHDLTPLGEVAALTFSVLAAHTRPTHHDALRGLVVWLAENPPERLSYEAKACDDAHREFSTLTREQVVAVMNICWGGRPRQAQTSLMGQFLLDPEFRPSDSPTHIRALVYYKTAMRAGEHQARWLTDRITR